MSFRTKRVRLGCTLEQVEKVLGCLLGVLGKALGSALRQVEYGLACPVGEEYALGQELACPVCVVRSG